MKILLVDDDQISTFITKNVINKSNIKIDLKTSLFPKQALDDLQQINEIESLPQLILLDLNMPLVDGFQFIELLMKMHSPKSDIKICVLLSSKAQDDIDRAYKYKPVIDFITKPLTISSLNAVLAKLDNLQSHADLQ